MILWCACFFAVSPLHAQTVPGIGAETGAISSAAVNCLVITPIGIAKVKDMSFGAIVTGNAGSVVLSPDLNSTTTSGNIKTEASRGNVSAAVFEVNDGMPEGSTQQFYAGYSITLPTGDVTLVSQQGATMRVGNFTSSPSASGVGAFTNGKGVLAVGATLYVNENQAIGKYASTAPFPVTVNFY